MNTPKRHLGESISMAVLLVLTSIGVVGLVSLF